MVETDLASHQEVTAESEKAILVIDEIDSMLFGRRRARHSWEITFTNDFLTSGVIWIRYLPFPLLPCDNRRDFFGSKKYWR